MKKMKTFLGGVMMAFVAASMMTAVSAAPAPVAAIAAQKAPVTGKMKGVIKTLDDASLVIVLSGNRAAEATFKVTSATTRTGAVAAGDEATVTFYFAEGQRVATVVAGETK